MTEVTQKNRQLAKFAATAFGGVPKVERVREAGGDRTIDVLSCAGSLSPQITAYSTVGLSDHVIRSEGRDLGFRVEIAMAGYTPLGVVRDVLASCAFYVLGKDWVCRPDVVLQNVVDKHAPGLALRHILFVDPFMWPGLSRCRVEGMDVLWVHGVPITDAEYSLSKQKGVRALLTAMEAHSADVCDLQRTSVA